MKLEERKIISVASSSADGSAVTIPANYAVTGIWYCLQRQWQVESTTWSERTGVRTIDSVHRYFPQMQGLTLPFNNQNLFSAADHDWVMGVDAVYSDAGRFDQRFEKISNVLTYADSPTNAIGSFWVCYWPHSNDPDLVDFTVNIYIHRV